MKNDLPERTFSFACRAVKLCQMLGKTRSVPPSLANQLLRSATSIGANVEEGQASQSKADFVAKYSIACKEAREAHYWLRLIGATGLVGEDRLSGMVDEADQLVAILTTIVKKCRPSRTKGRGEAIGPTRELAEE